MPSSPKIPWDGAEYEHQTRADSSAGRCFICSIVGSFTEAQYVELQRRVHRVGRAVSTAVPTERLYVLTLGSHQGNAHVHWHVAPLPPGVPYQEQQFVALMHEHDYLDIPEADLADVARRIREHLQDAAP